MNKHIEFIFGAIILFMMIAVFWQFIGPKDPASVVIAPATTEDVSRLTLLSPQALSVIPVPNIASEAEYQTYMTELPSLVWEVSSLLDGCTYTAKLVGQGEESLLVGGTITSGTNTGEIIRVENTFNPTKYYYQGDYDLVLQVDCPQEHPAAGSYTDSTQIRFEFETEELSPIACPADALECPDGSFVGRVAPDCEFAACPTATDVTPIITNGPYFNRDGSLACNGAAMICQTGELVYPLPTDCSVYEQCPTGEPVECADGVKECPDGSFIERDIDCAFAACPAEGGGNGSVEVGECQNDPYPNDGQNMPVACDDPACNVGPCVESGSPEPAEPVACTMDAKQCPDGSYVGRVAPSCEFAPCPSGGPGDTLPSPVVSYCDPLTLEEKMFGTVCATLYDPVCASVQVECVTTPCDPVQETFGNSCSACGNERVISYTEGACEGDNI